MKQLQPDLSDNLYYMDSLGDISAQLQWLDSMQILEAAFCSDADGVQSVVLICLPSLFDAVIQPDRLSIQSKFYQIFPSKDRKVFGGEYVVDICHYLSSRLCQYSSIIYYKPLNLQINEIS